jgi:PhoH-like ATPase
MEKSKKIFVLDTNVILHNHKCIFKFEDNDIVIPIVVLEELDKFKKGNDIINFHAREFTRELDKLVGDNFFSKGVNLGTGLGKIFIETGKPFSEKLSQSFSEKTEDHRILSIAEFLKDKNPGKKVILVTKDINLRMKAKSIDVQAQDYESDKVSNIDSINKGITTYEDFDNDLIAKLYEDNSIDLDKFNLKEKPYSHEYFLFKNNKSSVLAHYNPVTKTINRIEKHAVYGIEPRNAEQTFAIDALTRTEIPLVALTGKAGTGKTLLALASALHQKNQYNQILLARPVVPLANRDMGFLPGDVQEKIGPYMQPLYDNLSVIKSKFRSHSPEYSNIEAMLKEEKLVITPLAYIRGRSLSDIYFIVDEAQNLTPHEIKTIITRVGENAKIVFTGDIEQIDSPFLDAKSNGLSYLADKMKDQDVFAHVNLVKGERSYLSELASKIL